MGAVLDSLFTVGVRSLGLIQDEILLCSWLSSNSKVCGVDYYRCVLFVVGTYLFLFRHLLPCSKQRLQRIIRAWVSFFFVDFSVGLGPRIVYL